VISRTTREYQHFLEEYAVLLEKRFGAKNEMGKGARRVEALLVAKTTGTPKPKRTMSASARRKIAAAQKARWAKFRAQKKAA
jgi:hypothetical protein